MKNYIYSLIFALCVLTGALPHGVSGGEPSQSTTKVIGWNVTHLPAPYDLTDVVAIAATNQHSLALKSDGKVVGWGNNEYGQAAPPAGLIDVVAIALGNGHSLALKSDGKIVGWGLSQGATPPAGLTDVVAIAAGRAHSLALKNDGTVVGWGWNYYGQATPPAGLIDVVAIAAGYGHSLALKSDGTVVGWGYNNYGQTTPPNGLIDVVAISAGYSHSLALKNDGTVVGWGWNYYGQVTPPTGLIDVVAIAAGHLHSLALKSDGTVVGWGYNYFGPATPPVGLIDAVVIAAGGYHNLALKSDGTVAGWGNNLFGQATPPVGLIDAVAIAAGGSHSLALKSDGTVVGWGDNGYNNATPPAGLIDVVAIAAGGRHSVALKSDGKIVGWGLSQGATPSTGLIDVVAIATGDSHNLFLRSGGTVFGMGANWYGQMIPPAGLIDVVAIAAGYGHSLALKSDGTVIGWGWNYYGQATPPAGLIDVVAIAAGYDHSLALKSDGTVVGWGQDHTGQQFTHVRNAIAIAAGGDTCLVIIGDDPFAGLSPDGLVFGHRGEGAWFMQDSVFPIGVSNAARSGNTDHNTTSWIETVLSGPGTLSYWRKVSSEEHWDFFNCYIGGSLVETLSGEHEWAVRHLNIPSGTHTVRWEYSKDGSVDAGMDAAFIANVQFDQSTRPDFVVSSIVLNPASPFVGGPFSAVVTVMNQGNAAGDAGWLDIFTDSSLPVPVGSDGEQWVFVGELQPGETAQHTFTVLFVSAGERVFRAFIDSYDETLESDETNNQTTLTYWMLDSQTYTQWSSLLGLSGAASAAQYRHGPVTLSNLEAFAMGLNPLTATALDLPRMAAGVGVVGELVMSYRVNPAAVGVERWFEGSMDLTDWQVQEPLDEVVTGLDGTTEIREATFSRGSGEKLFIRMGHRFASMVLVEGGTLATSIVTVDTFYIGRYEVTWGEWQEVRTWAAANGYDIGIVGAGCAADHPVHSVNWYDVVKWCNAKSEKEGLAPVYTVSGSTYRSGQREDVAMNAAANGYRLPLEAEWEFAARGGNQTNGYTYSGSNDLNAVGWYGDNSGGAGCNMLEGRGTWPVGQKVANELGLNDMSGNVLEWCWNQNGPYRYIRGGSWLSLANVCTVSFRNSPNPELRNNSYGFRLARSSGF